MKIRHNVIYGLLGFVIPTLVMLLSVPILILGLGQEGFGVFMLAASVGGSFAFLDFGFSSATTKYVAEDMSQQKMENVGSIIKTSIAFYSALSILIAVVVWFIAPFLPDLFSVSTEMRSQAVMVFRIASLQFGVFLLVNVYISLFKAFHRFDIASLVAAYVAVMGNAGAAWAVWMDLVGLLGATFIGLFASISGLCIAHVVAARICQTKRVDLKMAVVSIAILRRMLGFSAILTVHSLAAVFFAQAQRLIIGGLLGPASVTIYQVAYAVASKSHSLINAATEVIFPVVSELRNYRNLRYLYLRALILSSGFALAILIPLGLFASPLITLWVGNDISMLAAPILRILAIAFFFVAISAPSFHVVNGLGKPGINVLYSVSNVCVYIVVLWWLSRSGKFDLIYMAWAFALSNVITGLIFQLVVFRLVMQLDRD